MTASQPTSRKPTGANPATFVLVHGSWKGTWSWDGVRDRLRAYGYREQAKITGTAARQLHFAWAGSTEPQRPHYYRIHGPRLLIEYDNTQRGANHVHTVWRDPDSDFGRDLLADHYATSH